MVPTTKYQESLDGEDGFFLEDDFICLRDQGKVFKSKLDKIETDIPLTLLLENFFVVKYFPDHNFVIGSPIQLKMTISKNYETSQMISGICDINEPDHLRSSNTWDAEWSTVSSLFQNADKVPDRTYLPKDLDCTREGWLFSAPFLYSGVFVKDRVLRRRVLRSIEATLYRMEKEMILNLPHSVMIDNIFSKDNPAWAENVPALGF
jgi:hypothetical protein